MVNILLGLTLVLLVVVVAIIMANHNRTEEALMKELYELEAERKRVLRR